MSADAGRQDAAKCEHGFKAGDCLFGCHERAAAGERDADVLLTHFEDIATRLFEWQTNCGDESEWDDDDKLAFAELGREYDDARATLAARLRTVPPADEPLTQGELRSVVAREIARQDEEAGDVLYAQPAASEWKVGDITWKPDPSVVNELYRDSSQRTEPHADDV